MLILGRAKWHRSAEVVIVGYGAAGAVAAITAHDEGAQVLILEKQPSTTHTSNSVLAGGEFISPSDVSATEAYLRALCQVNDSLSWTDSETIRVWAKYTCENREWVSSLGGELKHWSGMVGSHREIPGNENMWLWYFEGGGSEFMAFFKGNVERRGIEVIHGAKAERLICNSRGRVIGVVATGEGGQAINIKASRAVILTTGGFEFDEAMKLQFLRCYPFYFTGSPANTGDGVRMTMGVGAALWHMNCCAAGFVMKFPDFPIAFSAHLRGRDRDRQWRVAHITQGLAVCGYVVVDKRGKRFTNENFKNHHVNYELALYDSKQLQYPRVPSYWIMDQKRIDDGPLCSARGGAAGPAGSYSWSEDNSKESELGWIVQADTVKELAQRLGISSDSLSKTVENYNIYCRHNDDPEFRRRPNSLVPMNNPPYYAVKVWPGGPNTQGGPRRNYKAQVVSVDGEAIPGLYAAGELGSVFGMLYTGGGNLAECISFGRLAGEHAARERYRHSRPV